MTTNAHNMPEGYIPHGASLETLFYINATLENIRMCIRSGTPSGRVIDQAIQEVHRTAAARPLTPTQRAHRQ